MGNDLNVVYKGKVIASLGRKHNYTLDGESNLPTKEEIKYGIKSTREHIISTLCVYAGVLAGKSDDIRSIVSQIEEEKIAVLEAAKFLGLSPRQIYPAIAGTFPSQYCSQQKGIIIILFIK